MSHVVSIDVQITDLDCLAQAAADCGFELRRGQSTYRWWGESVGDYPIPIGFTAEDLGHCDHALSIPGDGYSYEIGVVRSRDGRPGYTLIFDFYDQRNLLAMIGGQSGARLRQAYAGRVALKAAKKSGYRLIGQSVKPDGSIVYRVGR